MMKTLTQIDAEQLIYREGYCLDSRDWDNWLQLFTEDAVFWVPAWKDENEQTSCPDTELSLIYYEGRQALKDRIWRLNSRLSAASTPLRRTAHMTSNILVHEQTADHGAKVTASFAVFQFDPKRQSDHVFFGNYEYLIRFDAGSWRIAWKKVILANDHIPAVADVYLL